MHESEFLYWFFFLSFVLLRLFEQELLDVWFILAWEFLAQLSLYPACRGRDGHVDRSPIQERLDGWCRRPVARPLSV